MSIQMSLIFGALVAEMVVLLVLLLPLPFKIRSKVLDIFTLLNQSTNVKVGAVFSGSLLTLSFVDCLRRLQRYSSDANNQPYFTTASFRLGGNLSYDQLATKFYTQRNLYLNGAVLYLFLSIFTVVGILKKLVKKETEYRALSLIDKGLFADESEEIEKYQDLVKQKELDIETFKKQVKGLQKSYDDLNPAETGDKKKD